MFKLISHKIFSKQSHSKRTKKVVVRKKKKLWFTNPKLWKLRRSFLTFTSNRVIVNDPKKSWYEKELRFTNTVKPRCIFLTFTAIRNKFRFQNFLKIPDVHNTIHRFLTVHAAVTPTSVLPAPGHEKNVHIRRSSGFYTVKR